jgi:glutathione peroxidase-family protein
MTTSFVSFPYAVRAALKVVSVLAICSAALPQAWAQAKPAASAAKPTTAASASAERLPSTIALRGFTLEGKPFTLDSEKGKVVLVLFWSTKSPISRDNMPELRANYEGWRSKGFQLVAVSVDERSDDAMNYDKLIQLTVPVKQQFPNLWRGDKAYSDNLGTIAAVPTAYLIGRDGKLVKRFTGRMKGDDWDAIAELVL